MTRKCQYCKKVYGEKEPFEDKTETHGCCDECFEIEMKKIGEMTEKKKGKK